MTKVTEENNQFVGIDVAKDHLDIYIYPAGVCYQIANRSDAIALFAKDILCQYAIASITMEATGGYEKAAIEALNSTWQVRRAHPNYVYNFAKALGKKAKTDRIDAKIIAQYGAFIEDQASGTPKLAVGVDGPLQALVSRREQLQTMILAERNRLEKSQDSLVNKGINKVVALLQKEMHVIEQGIRQRINAVPEAKFLNTLLRSFKGVGEHTAARLIAFLPELGSLNKRQIAALVGLAPYNKDSGTKTGKRSICGGRKCIRSSLYMAALVAIRYNTVIKKHYDKLIAAGKTFKVAITAVMRKILVILNTMIKYKQTWKFAEAK